MGVLLTLLAVLFLAAPVIPALLPRRLLGLGHGVLTLIAGVLFLSEHGQPQAERGNQEGDILLYLWAMLAIAGMVGRLAVELTRGRFREWPDAPPLLAWATPVGLLAAVFGLHWLSNRLAGVGPAWLMHGVAIGAAVTAAAVGWRYRPRDRLDRAARRFLLSTAVSLLALLIWAAGSAPFWYCRAGTAAQGSPWCVLTFAGRDHARPARSVWELSPLVSRSGGRSAFDDAGWLLIRQGSAINAWRRHGGGWQQVVSLPGPPACQPVIGGNP